MGRKPNEAGIPPDPRVDVAGLRTFVAIARHGAVGRAARALGRTQPTVSGRLAELERVWKTRLFRRVARGMTITPEGSHLLPLAEAALRDLQDLDRAAGVPVAPSGDLRVGAGDALGRRRLPRALAALLREHPTLEVQIREGPGPRLVEALRDGEIDLALVVRSGPAPPVDGIDFAPLLTSEVDLLVPRGEPGDRRRAVSLRHLARRRLVVLQPGSGFRQHLEAAFQSGGLAFEPAVEVGNLSLVRRFVEAGLGVAPVPAVAFGRGDAHRGVERRRLAGIAPVSYDRAVRSGAPLPAATARLLALLG